ncbi:MAG: SDR family NAD(P)-dependent oxidoreductase [Alphaproteobacteria bacterium]
MSRRPWRVVRGKLNPARAVVDHMVERQKGSIVFITSEGGRFPTPGQTTTSLMAGGLIMMTKVVARGTGGRISEHRGRDLVEDTPSWDRVKSGESARMSVYGKIRQAPDWRSQPISPAPPFWICRTAPRLSRRGNHQPDRRHDPCS